MYSMKILDLSQEISHSSKTYPGDLIGVKIGKMASLETDNYTRSRFDLLDFHYGTHIDMPSHFVAGGRDVSSLICLWGKAVIVGVSNMIIDQDAFQNHGIEEGDVVLICTKWDEKLHTREYFTNYPYLTEEVATFLATRKIRCLGLDTPSPDSSRSEDFKIHKILLKSGIPIIEGMVNLNEAYTSGRKIFFAAFPLKIAGAEASPVRAIAILYNEGEIVWPNVK